MSEKRKEEKGCQRKKEKRDVRGMKKRGRIKWGRGKGENYKFCPLEILAFYDLAYDMNCVVFVLLLIFTAAVFSLLFLFYFIIFTIAVFL